MSKRSYRAVHVNNFNWNHVQEQAERQVIVVGVDVAKEKMAAAVMDQSLTVLKTIKWSHPAETPVFMEFVKTLREAATRIEVALEPSGVYGDALRWQLIQAGFAVYRVSPKKTHNMAEVYDGVPSWHDAKSAAIIAKLHFDGTSREWPIETERRRALTATLRVLEVHSKQFRQNRNRLEGLTARHWPELTRSLALDSAALLELLIAYGGPAAVARDCEGAWELMRRVGGNKLDPAKISAMVAGAGDTMGMPQVAEEVELVQALALEARRNQRAVRKARRRVEELAMAVDGSTQAMQAVVGKTTAAVLVAAAGDPRSYDSPQALVKSFGLNLRERSSGEKQNRGVHITKRGSSAARMYLWLAALRLLQRDPVVAAWYAKKVRHQGGTARKKAVVAVMRKLVLALWHVARGATFDASKLFDTRRLDLTPPAEGARSAPAS